MRLREKAYHLIKQRIITLELPPLSFIDEQALMEDLHLGRTPIREALHQLASENLVIFAPRRGMFVADISITDLHRLWEMRLVLEGFCARLAAERITPSQLAQMKDVILQLDDVSPGDSKGLMAIDERFHRILYEAADNEFLSETLGRLHDLSFRLWHLVLDRLGDVRGAMDQHVQVFEALKAGDGCRAEAVVQRHISEFQEQIKAVL